MRKREGFLLVDNRNSGGELKEGMTFTCGHCDALVVKNPDRTRERHYCRGCDTIICDTCAAIKAQTLTCRPIQQLIDQCLTAAEKQSTTGSPILLR